MIFALVVYTLCFFVLLFFFLNFILTKCQLVAFFVVTNTVDFTKFFLIVTTMSTSDISREWSEGSSVQCRFFSTFRSMEATVKSMASARTAELAVRRAVAGGESG